MAILLCLCGSQVFGQPSTQQLTEMRKAAEQGFANAQYILGSCYDLGSGVPKDHAEAVKWFRKAADQGSADAQFSLGDCYYKGEGVLKDYAEAAKWFRKAAEQGDADAQNNLGNAYLNGEGVLKDGVMACMWFNLSAKTGNADAAKSREIVDKRMTPEQIAEAQRMSREWKPKKEVPSQ